MTDVMDHAETDVRERILITAERLFREIGYQKTTVADIAKTLRMSPANVYRFFDSKKSITAGVARRLMGEVEQALQAIAKRPGNAVERLRELLQTVHRMNSDRYAGDSKMHEMVAVAMEENWDVCLAHIEYIVGVTGEVIADGVASGEFHAADVRVAALTTLTAMLRFIHPQYIAEFADKPTATLDQMIDFVIVALRAPAGQRAS
ncbi:MAG: TetR/AcrR family transcriptional regulator [Xanthobacteraceae bacterium]|jgi:AcrR family transcriptional regulator